MRLPSQNKAQHVHVPLKNVFSMIFGGDHFGTATISQTRFGDTAHPHTKKIKWKCNIVERKWSELNIY